MLTAGTDIKELMTTSAAVLLAIAFTFGAVAAYLWRGGAAEEKAIARSLRVPTS
jgi:hypothetical protein